MFDLGTIPKFYGSFFRKLVFHDWCAGSTCKISQSFSCPTSFLCLSNRPINPTCQTMISHSNFTYLIWQETQSLSKLFTVWLTPNFWCLSLCLKLKSSKWNLVSLISSLEFQSMEPFKSMHACTLHTLVRTLAFDQGLWHRNQIT